MAGYADLVRQGVALADALTTTLQVPVTVEPWLAQDGLGAPVYGPAARHLALVEAAHDRVRAADGIEKQVTTKVAFIHPVTLDVRARLTLPDGTRPPILAVRGLVDPGTNRPYLVEALCG